MLKTLHVSNVGTIDEAVLKPAKGMTVITGETGAGKSMLLDALAMLEGKRAPRGQKSGSHADAEFMDMDEGTPVRMSRDIGPGARGKSLIDGVKAKNAEMRELSGRLFTVHGQSDQIRLADPSMQLRLLDTYAGDDALADRWVQAHREADRIRAVLDGVDEDAGDAMEYLQEEVGKAERLNVEDGELARLTARSAEIDEIMDRRRRMLQAADSLSSAYESIRDARSVLGGDGDLDTALGIVAALMHDVDDVEDDEVEDVDAINGRISDIKSMVRRHGGSEAGLLAWIGRSKRKIEDYRRVMDSKDELETELKEAETREREAGMRLHDARVQAADSMSKAISGELDGLAMSGASVSISVDKAPMGMSGEDAVAFMFAPYEGAVLKPLGQSASGGELSRLMLAIELVSLPSGGSAGEGETMVFDEIDSGVGGRTADSLGARLRRLADSTQIIVVTHLAQVASYADVQYAVSRNGGSTTVSKVEGEDRVREIARMLDGDEENPVSVSHARSLLEKHQRL